MDPILLILLLFLAGLVLLAAELVLPASGLVGLLGVGAMAAAAVLCFRLNQWLGLAVVVGGVVAAPFAWALWVKLWPKTPVGRRLILNSVPAPVPMPVVSVGQVGLAVTEMRPTGVCEFDLGAGAGPERVEARSEHGIIPVGRSVRVVAVADRRPIVRAVERVDPDQ